MHYIAVRDPMTATSPLLTQLGLAVRTRRAALDWTLAELATRSGVSVRFLSDLEAGRGNISVNRLAQVADALGSRLDQLLHAEHSVDTGARAELAREIDLLAPDQAREALDWLRARRGAGKTFSKLALIGLRGAGKTSLGRAAARKLHVPFVEIDRLVEEAAGMPLSDIFSIHGEPYYRRLEREQLRAALARKGRAILATGGGIVTDPESFELLRASCFTIWLEASPDEHWSRVVAQGDHRPMKGRQQAMAELRAILKARRNLYSSAHARVDTTALGFDSSADAIVRLAREHG